MKKILPIFLIPIILLSSCTIDWNDEKDKKIAELEKQTQELQIHKENKQKNDEGLFERNKECRKLEKEVATIVQKGSEIYSVFYSPVKKSCLVAYVTYEEVAIGDITRDVPHYIIRDILTFDWIFKEVDYPGFEKLVKELKGE